MRRTAAWLWLCWRCAGTVGGPGARWLGAAPPEAAPPGRGGRAGPVSVVPRPPNLRSWPGWINTSRPSHLFCRQPNPCTPSSAADTPTLYMLPRTPHAASRKGVPILLGVSFTSQGISSGHTYCARIMEALYQSLADKARLWRPLKGASGNGTYCR